MTEANKLEIPVVGTGDTNVDPDELDFIIPANDDAIRSIRLLCQLVADAAIEGARRAGRADSASPRSPRQPAAEDEPEFDETAAADLVAQLAAGGTLSFDPEIDDDDLLPGAPKAGRGGRRRPARRPGRSAGRARPRAGPAAGPGAPPDPRHRAGIRPPTPEPTRAPDRARRTPRQEHPRTMAESRPRPSRTFASAPAPASWTASARSRRPAATSTRPSRCCARRASPPPQKKAGRDAREGLVSSYIHTGGRVGVLIEVNCETDFVARTDEFQKLVRDLAIQVAGLAPTVRRRRRDPRGRPRGEEGRRCSPTTRPGKPEAIREKIVEGQLNKWYKEVCLLDQPFRDEDRTVRDLVTEKIATIGENIRVRRFTRYALGEEL